MNSANNCHPLGLTEILRQKTLQHLKIKRTKIALIYKDDEFTAISGVCNHVGGPLGQGHLEGDYVVCPWHYYKFHRRTGEGEPGYEADRVPAYSLKIEDGQLWIDLNPV